MDIRQHRKRSKGGVMLMTTHHGLRADGGESTGQVYSFKSSFEAMCSHCERRETFESRQTAIAWLSGHIEAEHSDKLPPFEGVE